MVDFESSAGLLKHQNIAVIAASVDDAEQTAALAAGLRLNYVQMVHGIDAHAVAEATGAFMQEGDKTFLHATGFLLKPDGTVHESVFASGPIGRLLPDDVMKRVRFAEMQAAKAAQA